MAVGITLVIICVVLIAAFLFLQLRSGGTEGDDKATPMRRQSPTSSEKTPDERPAPRDDAPAEEVAEFDEAADFDWDASLEESAEELFADAAADDELSADGTDDERSADGTDDDEATSSPKSSPASVSRKRAHAPTLRSLPSPTAASSPSSAPDKPSRPSSTGGKPHWFVGVTKNIRDKTFHVGNKRATIGRLPNNLIQLGDGDVSRVHCQIRPEDGALKIVPMETKNGTRVNGELVEPHSVVALEDGDLLEIGNTVFVYYEQADYDTDETTAKKSRGISAEAATAVVGGERWATRIRDELTAHGGDIDKTARTLGIEPSVLSHMIDQLGVERS